MPDEQELSTVKDLKVSCAFVCWLLVNAVPVFCIGACVCVLWMDLFGGLACEPITGLDLLAFPHRWDERWDEHVGSLN
jgi:hypothetical protein